MIRKALVFCTRPLALAILLKGLAYTSTTAVFMCPKWSWLFAVIAAASGTTFYLLLGCAAFSPLIRGYRRLGRECRVGNLDEEGRPVTRHDCWL